LERSVSISPKKNSGSSPSLKRSSFSSVALGKKASIVTIMQDKQPSSIANETSFKSSSRNIISRGVSDVGYNSGSDQGRVYFPREVKLDAIKLMEEGKTQAEVAKDLNCSVSTVASWWHRRHTTKKNHKYKKVSSKLIVNSQNSSGISLSPSSYDSSERDGETGDIPNHMAFAELQNDSRLHKSVRINIYILWLIKVYSKSLTNA
jgi:hypothetical protein